AASMRNLISMFDCGVPVVISKCSFGNKHHFWFHFSQPKVQFGDMIAYPPVCDGKITLQHFAVYVGDRTFPATMAWLGYWTLSPTCIFSTLNVADKPYVFNYLDGYKENGKEYKKGKEEKMEERIREKYNKCSLYSAVGNNCEHLATYVRYGEKISLQVRVTDSTVDNISPFAANIHNSVTHFIRSP
uniref:LRAT domain-containing protein n=1 Tax=Scophthalmus maximus TaxID=52904 RepID=A0A8D3BR64_SCOMX